MSKDPYFPSLRHEVDRLFDSLVHATWGQGSTASRWTPAVDVSEEPDRYRIEVDLPGVRAADLSITATRGSLKIEGTRERVRRSSAERHHLVERNCGHFLRSFHLPANAEVDDLRAQLIDGMLIVEIPKKDPRRRG